MKSAQLKSIMLAAALGTAASLSACHDGGQTTAPPPPASTTVNFSTFAINTFQAQANSAPVNFDNLTLVYDVNTDPTAFDALLM